MEIKEGDVVLCEVKGIEGTTVFLDVEGGYSGSMMLSEVAAGRIRNLRDYVTIGKKIVCKVLKSQKDSLELSLRRVTAKEREQVLDRYKKERALANILKLVGEEPEKLISVIKKDYDISDFFEKMQSDSSILEKYLNKEKARKVSQAICEKVLKERKVSSKIILRSFAEEGILHIKEVLDLPNAEVHYLGSSVFSVAFKGKEFKEAKNNLNVALQEIERRAKAKKVVFEIVREK